jgi:hypothetical protein
VEPPQAALQTGGQPTFGVNALSRPASARPVGGPASHRQGPLFSHHGRVAWTIQRRAATPGADRFRLCRFRAGPPRRLDWWDGAGSFLAPLPLVTALGAAKMLSLVAWFRRFCGAAAHRLRCGHKPVAAGRTVPPNWRNRQVGHSGRHPSGAKLSSSNWAVIGLTVWSRRT